MLRYVSAEATLVVIAGLKSFTSNQSIKYVTMMGVWFAHIFIFESVIGAES